MKDIKEYPNRLSPIEEEVLSIIRNHPESCSKGLIAEKLSVDPEEPLELVIGYLVSLGLVVSTPDGEYEAIVV